MWEQLVTRGGVGRGGRYGWRGQEKSNLTHLTCLGAGGSWKWFPKSKKSHGWGAVTDGTSGKQNKWDLKADWL